MNANLFRHQSEGYSITLTQSHETSRTRRLDGACNLGEHMLTRPIVFVDAQPQFHLEYWSLEIDACAGLETVVEA